MAKKENTFVGDFLEFLTQASELIPLPLETPYAWVKRQRSMSRSGYSAVVSNLSKRGVVEITNKNGKKFIKITRKGELETLLAKANLPHKEKWDGKWRLFIFDIPESSRDKRDGLRALLKKNNFKKLQASVFISPYPLNRDALTYLKQTKLIDYIRIMRIDELDHDRELKKKFGLK